MRGGVELNRGKLSEGSVSPPLSGGNAPSHACQAWKWTLRGERSKWALDGVARLLWTGWPGSTEGRALHPRQAREAYFYLLEAETPFFLQLQAGCWQQPRLQKDRQRY